MDQAADDVQVFIVKFPETTTGTVSITVLSIVGTCCCLFGLFAVFEKTLTAMLCSELVYVEQELWLVKRVLCCPNGV